MKVDRGVVRLILPPVAAAALIAGVVTPSLAGPSDPAPTSSPQTGTARTGGTSAAAVAARSGNVVVVGVPAVAFTETVTAVGGHLRTPVLINVAEVPGRVRVLGAGQTSGCRAQAQPGVVLWLDCSVDPGAASNPRIRVTLDDGRRVEKPILLG